MLDFQGFSPGSFEQLTCALAQHVFGPKVTFYGPGPDGGRDVTFRGKTKFARGTDDCPWEGYGVIQAKFKTKRAGTREDQRWAVEQLNNELKQWHDAHYRNPKPDYFVFCTNVALTAAAGGGRDRLEAILADQARALGLKDFAVWDANQIAGYIENSHEIRRRFICFFTPGDVLAEMAKRLPQRADLDAVLTPFLCRELITDEDARLSQAGDRSDDRIKLADVFIDLPATDEAGLFPNEVYEEQGAWPISSLEELSIAASRKLDPLSLYEQAALEAVVELRLYARFVFVGGPGSGKSTIGQFLAQMHRAALLDRRPTHRLEPRIRQIIDSIRHRCDQDLVPWPQTPRFPCRVELNAFAKWVDDRARQGSASTLSDYLRSEWSRNVTVTHDDLREWLRRMPWILVLDGLDEVPAASNRAEVVAAIEDFLGEARDIEADMLVVASTRPDGYSGELGGKEVRTLYLSPLPAETALDCARRYIDARLPMQAEHRRKTLLEIVATAIDKPLTARLMTSPLQVTFMVIVIAANGQPSESRWQLFTDYYRIIYDRELQKAISPVSEVLSRRRQDIDALHHRVGFILQYRAELSGGTQADMTIGEFEWIVERFLDEAGLHGTALTAERQAIVDAARLRLVILTSRTAGRLRFEVRSLQEYMAAACITNDAASASQRLMAIAPSIYWRNTFLFAVNRFFADASLRERRGEIRLLCEDLNLNLPTHTASRLGSQLALAILKSGSVGAIPLVARSLAACALEILQCPSSSHDGSPLKLGAVYDSLMEIDYRETLTLLLDQKQLARAEAAWMLLLFLEQRGVGWATSMAEARWPANIDDAETLMEAWLHFAPPPGTSSELVPAQARRLQKLIAGISPKACNDLLSRRLRAGRLASSGWLKELPTLFRHETLHSKGFITIADAPTITLQITPLVSSSCDAAAAALSMLVEESPHLSWLEMMPVFTFIAEPNATTLAAALRRLGDCQQRIDWDFWLTVSPWPLACCVPVHPTRESLHSTADRIPELFGDIGAWSEIEERWRTQGLSLREFLGPMSRGPLPLVRAFRYLSADLLDEFEGEPIAHRLLRDLVPILPTPSRSSLAFALTRSLQHDQALERVNPSLLRDWLLKCQDFWLATEFQIDPKNPALDAGAWLDFYDHLGRLPRLSATDTGTMPGKSPVYSLLAAFCEDPSRTGLLRLSAFWCALGWEPPGEALEMLEHLPFDLGDFEWARQVVLMCDPTLTPARINVIATRLAQLAAKSTRDDDIRETVALALERYLSSVPTLQAMIDVIFLPGSHLRARAEHLRNLLLQIQPSGLTSNILVQLHVPASEQRGD